MPGRKSQPTVRAQKTKTRKPRASTRKSLNALSIASRQTNERPKGRSHRLGELAEGENGQDRALKTGRQPQDDLDDEGGSDSEGNEWRLGQVDSDDDSDLNSDEAFGESDEEKFEDFRFGGSKSNKSPRGTRTPEKSGRQGNEGNIVQEREGTSEEDELGEDAVDLGDLLDASEEESGSDALESDDEDAPEDQDTLLSFSYTEADAHNSSKLSKLRSLVESLEDGSMERNPKRRRIESAAESYTPSEYAVTSSKKLTLEDMLSSVNDPIFKNSLRILDPKHKSKNSLNTSGIPGKLEVPLAKRQQDRIDRAAAYKKSKETLDRWIDTVKHNRRAEHLSFPAADSNAPLTSAGKRLSTTSGSAPFNEFEQKIQAIMQESGLGGGSGKKEEERLQAFEELETRTLPLEEVQARRAQLRIARELLYREEVRAKRIKKIKSRSYRRVHRKQREKQDEEERAALAAAGIYPSRDELEEHERKRAEERMGAKHRESKWAKGVKDSGRSVWDDDARQGVVAMAQRNDELRKRISGKPIRNYNDDTLHSMDEDSEEEEESDSENEDGEADRLLTKLDRTEARSSIEPGEKNGLLSMKFMQRAEANRKQENDDAAERLRRELLGEDPYEDNDSSTVPGRRILGPQNKAETPTRNARTKVDAELDEGVLSGDEVPFEGFESERSASPQPHSTKQNEKHRLNGNHDSLVAVQQFQAMENSPLKSSNTRKRARTFNDDEVLINTQTIPQLLSSTAQKQQVKTRSKSQDAPDSVNTWQAVAVTIDDETSSDGSEEDEAQGVPSLKNSDLIKRAFAGDDVLQQFETEKTQAMSDEEEKMIDKTLPGWGSWTGEGMSKKAQRRNQGKVFEKQPGVAKEKRKDAKLERVLINEKRVKKNMKYLASNLPHPFETRQQYERSLRLPVGPEWTTKETFQAATKPRVLIKQGVIAPMSRPII